MVVPASEPRPRALEGIRGVSIFIVEPLSLVCDCLTGMLESRGYAVVGQARTGSEALHLLASLRPLIVCCEVDLPDGSGFDVCRFVSDRLPASFTIAVTARDDAETVTAAAQAGFAGFVSKRSGIGDLLASIRAVVHGGGVFGPSDSLADYGQLTGRKGRGHVDVLWGLSPRERQVAVCVARGLTNKESAAELCLAPITVRNHLSKVMRKIGVRSRAEVAAAVALAGWLRST